MTEVMIAAIVATIILMAVAAALTSGISANRTIKGNEQGTGLANRVIEDARNRPFDELVMDTATLTTTDPLLSQSGTTWSFSGGPSGAETVVHGSGGAIKRSEVVNDPALGVKFTVRTYVTDVSGAASSPTNQIRRVSTIVSYQRDGATFTSRSSTEITQTRRGLPEPKFEITPETQTVPTSQDNDLVLPHTVRNLGVSDAYDITAPTASRSAWNAGIKIYGDSNQSELYEPGVDQLLVDTNGNGKVDTGNVPTNGTSLFFIVYAVPTGEVSGSVTVSTTVISGAHDTVSKAITDQASVNFRWERYFLYNQQQFSDEPVDSDLVGSFSSTLFPFPMPMDPREPSELDSTGNEVAWNHLPDYGQNQSVHGPGRPVWPASAVPAYNGSLNAAASPYVAAWEHKVPTASPAPTYGPHWWTQLYVANADSIACTTPIKLRIYVNKVTGTGPSSASGTVTAIGSKTFTFDMSDMGHAGGDCEFKGALFGISNLPTTQVNGAWLQYRIVVDETTGTRTAPVLLSYGPYSDTTTGRKIFGPSLTWISRQS